jgi:hypothetical protein
MVFWGLCHWSDAMKLNSFTTLKWGSVVLAIFWTGWMMYWTGSFDVAAIVIWSICGAAFGVFWYFGMRLAFKHIFLLAPDGTPMTPGAPRSKLYVWMVWTGFMVLSGIATRYLLELASPLIPQGNWHWLISALFVVLVWPALMWSMRPLIKRHLPA